MKPSLGRIVILNDATQPSNGTSDMPAIVTRVWGDGDPADALGSSVCVNLTAFPDNAEPRPVSSVNLFETEEEARDSGFSRAAWWPGRQRAQAVTEDAPNPGATAIETGTAVGYGDSASVG